MSLQVFALVLITELSLIRFTFTHTHVHQHLWFQVHLGNCVKKLCMQAGQSFAPHLSLDPVSQHQPKVCDHYAQNSNLLLLIKALIGIGRWVDLPDLLCCPQLPFHYCFGTILHAYISGQTCTNHFPKHCYQLDNPSECILLIWNIQTTILYLIVSLIGMILQGKMNWPKRCKPCLTKPDHRLQNQPKQPHPSLQAVQPPAILDAVLETTARLTQAATVM